jgi:hypothetical protein
MFASLEPLVLLEKKYLSPFLVTLGKHEVALKSLHTSDKEHSIKKTLPGA